MKEEVKQKNYTRTEEKANFFLESKEQEDNEIVYKQHMLERKGKKRMEQLQKEVMK